MGGKNMLEEKLREYFKKNKQTVGVNELTKILKLTEEEKIILSKTLYELEKEGKWNVLAIVSFSIAVACVLGYLAGGFFLHIVTLILSIVSLTQFRHDPTMKGKGFAVAGTVISSVSVGLSVIGTIVYLIMTMLGIVATGVIGGIFNEIFKEIFSSSVLLPTLFF